MSWHYLPVFIEHGPHNTEFSLCEVYIDKDGKLEGWTRAVRAPTGVDSIDDLRSALEMMLNDTRRWKPVRYVDLTAGMTFERADNEST